MDERRTVRVSKYLAKHLRHQPERIGLTPDEAGWVEIDTLLAAAADHGFPVTREELDHVVAANDKRRFAVEGTRIRASQGHTIPVDLQLPPPNPGLALPRHRRPERGRDPRRGPAAHERHAVHLSADRETATRVGARRGRPVVLSVDAGAMRRDGHVFHVSANGVWLTAAVPSRYLRFGDGR
ncbi:RNA 2'-phosphotransferase [Streptomyces thermocarboxydus]